MTHRVPTGSNARPDLPLAVVVGAGGMGMAVARRLGQHYRVLLADRDNRHLERAIATLHHEGHDATGIPCDVGDPGAVAALAARTAELGGPRVLAHVVGLSPSMGDFRALMTVNLVGATLVANAMLPLAAAGTAAIFVASLAGHAPAPDARVTALLDRPLDPGFIDALEAALGEPATPLLAYRLSKWALIRLCERAAPAWGKRRARILSLSPGLIATPMGALEFERQPMKYDLLARTPLEREGTLLEVGDAVEFLASERASFITGTDLLVDGGIAAALRHGPTA
jgi:NAD(P)-dependent dehydrogenase (short-subunit alcohol dehydrogenase family)